MLPAIDSPPPCVPAARAGRTGRLRLVFAVRAGRTVLQDSYAEPPFAVGRVFHPAGPDLAHVILVQTTAGLFGGDALDVEIEVQSGARVVLTSQAAQKVHPSAGGELARQTWRAHVARGGELHGYLDPLIPFTGARLEQSTRFELDDGGRLFWAEGLMAGRVQRGERWRFAQLRMETSLARGGRLAYLDRFALGDGGIAPDGRWAMDAHGYLATLLACGVAGARARAEATQAHLFDDRPAFPRGALGAVDAIDDDLLIGRALADDGVAFARLQRAWRQQVFDGLLGETEPAFRPRP